MPGATLRHHVRHLVPRRDHLRGVVAQDSIRGKVAAAAAGDLVSLTASTTPAQTFNVSGNTLTITNAEVLGNGAKVKVIATLTKTLSAEKTKTNQPCQLVLVDADATSGVEYGTASQHKEISLGKGDVFKLHAVLESDAHDADPKLPQFSVTGISGTFVKGETIVGATSGTQAMLINTTSPFTYLIKNSKAFTTGETVTGQTSGATASLSGSETAGSKDITNRFTLDTGQRDNFLSLIHI